MGKGALSRGQKAFQQALKTAEAEKQQSSEARAGAAVLESAQKRKQDALKKASEKDMFNLRHVVLQAIPMVTLGPDGKRINGSGDVDLNQPVILRFPPQFAEDTTLKGEIEGIRKAFGESAAKATSGRATLQMQQVILNSMACLIRSPRPGRHVPRKVERPLGQVAGVRLCPQPPGTSPKVSQNSRKLLETRVGTF